MLGRVEVHGRPSLPQIRYFYLMAKAKQPRLVERENYSIDPLQKGEYCDFMFTGCDFSNGDLSKILFEDCEFVNCNLSVCNVAKTVFRNVKFSGCKMMGVRFDLCNPFGLSFSFNHCILDHCSFFRTEIPATDFTGSRLWEADLAEAVLMGANFSKCDLTGATFDNTQLERADFRSAYGYSIRPDANKLKKAKFSLPAVTGLLDGYDIELEH